MEKLDFSPEEESSEIKPPLQDEVWRDIKYPVPERVKEVLRNKVLFVEDTNNEAEVVKDILGDVNHTSDLKSALNNLETNKKEFKYVLTDLMYPLGELKEEHKVEFYERYAKGLNETIESINPAYDKIPAIKEYIKQVSQQEASEVPSGILLSLFALLKNNQFPIIVTSLYHHNIKVEPINMLFQNHKLSPAIGFYESESAKTEGDSKDWENAIKEMLFMEEGWIDKGVKEQFYTRDKALVEENYNQKVQNLKNNSLFMNSELVKLSLDLKKYY